VRIEEFTEKDEGPVVALWERCGLLRPWNDPHEDIARKLHIQRDLFLVGKLDEEVVATVMGGYEGHRGWVNYLAVDPDRQRQGLGRAMMEEIQRRLESLGAPKINLQIRDDNLAAAAFYERIGFARDKVISMGKRL
jgi:ribosomal protein S18 acetylase RimI-like enzyme